MRKEGFEIEFPGHVSSGERVDRVIDSRRNLPFVSNEQQSIYIKRLEHDLAAKEGTPANETGVDSRRHRDCL
jgi:hypothetical protein